nr:cell cycle checkpoint protein rad17 [Quercus suber]
MPTRSARRKVTVITSSDDEDQLQRQQTSTTRSNQEKSRLLDQVSSSTDQGHYDDSTIRETSSRSNGKLKSVKKPQPVKSLASPSSTQQTSSQKSPDKSDKAPSTSKLHSRDTAKSSSKPIYSFFHAARERQASLQPSTSPEKRSPAPRIDLPEPIDSDEEANSFLRLSKDSSIALTLRKRKVQHARSFEDDVTLPLPSTQKFRKTGEHGRIPSFSSAPIQDTRPWTERFTPKDLTELAVHKRKVQDVSGWLQSTVRGRRQKVLILKGAAGTGKTTAIRLLARDLEFDIVEWRNPGEADAGEGVPSVSASFDDFVNRAGRSRALQFVSTSSQPGPGTAAEPGSGEFRDQERPHALLIEEFPTSLSRTSAGLQSFRSTILQYVSSPTVSQRTSPIPIVMVVSETLSSTNTAAADSFTAHRLLGPELANHPYIDTIEFNPIAPTFLMKALELVVVKEARQSGRRRTPGAEVLKHLAESGDIRSAISSLEFMCLRGDDVKDMWSSKVAFTKPKKRAQSVITKGEEEVLRLITNRESSLGIFHAVGRVCYNNRVEPSSHTEVVHPPEWMPQTLRRPKIPERDVDELMNELGTDVSTFIAALHENYARSCYTASTEMTLGSLVESIDSLSDADLLSVDIFSSGARSFSGSATESLRQDEIAYQAAVRGLLFNLPYPVHRSIGGEARKGDSHKMFYPASLKTWRRKEEIEDALDVLRIDAQTYQLGRWTARTRLREKNDANSDQANGVDTWARNSKLSEQKVSPETGVESQQEASSVGFGKMELLLERLPYAAHILHSRHNDELRPSPMNFILSVTQMTGLAPEHGELIEDEESNDRFAEAPNEPIRLAKSTTPLGKASSNAFIRVTKDDGGLSLTEGKDIGGLVLSDDDIEDW